MQLCYGIDMMKRLGVNCSSCLPASELRNVNWLQIGTFPLYGDVNFLHYGF